MNRRTFLQKSAKTVKKLKNPGPATPAEQAQAQEAYDNLRGRKKRSGGS